MQQHLFRQKESPNTQTSTWNIYRSNIFWSVYNLNRKESRDQHTFFFAIRKLHVHCFSLAILIEIAKHIPVQYFISNIDPVEQEEISEIVVWNKWLFLALTHSSLLSSANVVLFLNDITRINNHFHQDETDGSIYTHVWLILNYIPNSRNIGATKHSKIPSNTNT